MSQARYLTWRKATRSNGTGSNCVEVSAAWRKSSYSNATGANCVEVSSAAASVAVRDSKLNMTGDFPNLIVSRGDWAGLLASVRR